MKVLMLNGSPRKENNTGIALKEMADIFEKEGIEVQIIQVGSEKVSGCMACGGCKNTGKCAIDDIVNKVAAAFDEADGLILASPVYYASPNATLIALCDRLFYSSHSDKTMKVGCSIACARRGGTTASFDVLNKYFTISGMPVASGSYWNNIHGGAAGDAAEDKEGLQCMRNLARNMAFLMKSIALGKEKYGMPEKESGIRTSFIR